LTKAREPCAPGPSSFKAFVDERRRQVGQRSRALKASSSQHFATTAPQVVPVSSVMSPPFSCVVLAARIRRPGPQGRGHELAQMRGTRTAGKAAASRQKARESRRGSWRCAEP
jgi:hypothetical protein